MESDRLTEVRAHRAGLDDVVFVAITGSCGKTTTKDLASGLLAPSLPGTSNPGSGNCGAELVSHMMHVRPGHRFCIQELGAWGPDTLDRGLDIVRPDVGVVLNVRRDHYSQFRGLEHTQREKAKVVACLPATGTAILNADDPRVWTMRERTCATVVGFGASDDAEFQFADVRASWPERLSFELRFRGERHRVHTQLIGEHLVGSAAAAVAIAHTLGVPLAQAVDGLSRLAPTARRMDSVVTEAGVTFVRDDFKAPSDSLDEFLRFLDCAHARRKIAVVGRISDHRGRSRAVYTPFAHAAAKVVDLLVFVGDRPASLWGGSRCGSSGPLVEFAGARAEVMVFATVREASQFLHGELRPGDLVALKGSGVCDHLERILLVHQTDVQCWRARCGRTSSCDACALLGCSADLDDVVPASP